jgi:branched-chain amino acid transport system ATP-binding protein
VTLLAVEDVRGGYGGGADILNGISFSMNAGEILTIAGTNGAGKSTLAKGIVGLLPDLRGPNFRPRSALLSGSAMCRRSRTSFRR